MSSTALSALLVADEVARPACLMSTPRTAFLLCGLVGVELLYGVCCIWLEARRGPPPVHAPDAHTPLAALPPHRQQPDLAYKAGAVRGRR